jgi:hypothetical protein
MGPQNLVLTTNMEHSPLSRWDGGYQKDFLKSGPFSNLKLRAGWGQTGNQEILQDYSGSLHVIRQWNNKSYPLTPSDHILQEQPIHD